MYGGRLDVLGSEVQKAGVLDTPANRYINWPEMTIPGYGVQMDVNPHKFLAERRNVSFALLSRGQAPQVTMQRGNEEIYSSGITPIPDAGIWRTIGRGA